MVQVILAKRWQKRLNITMNRLLIFSTDFSPTNSAPFKSQENHVSCRALQSYNSPGDWARELFKPSKDSGSLVVKIEKKCFHFWWGFFGGTPQVGVFLTTFTWPWAPTHWAMIMAQENPHRNQKLFFFSIWTTRLAESVEGLNSSLAQSPGKL